MRSLTFSRRCGTTLGPARPEPLRMMESNHPPAMAPISPKARRVLWLTAKLAVVIILYFLIRGPGPLMQGGDVNLTSVILRIIRLAAHITLLFVLFGRDIRLLGRFLGPSRGAGRSILIVLVILLLTGVAAATLLGFGLLAGLRPGPEHNPGGEFLFEHFVKPLVDVGKAGPSVDIGKMAALALATALLGFVLAPIAEELLFRGALFLLLLRLVGKWPAVLLVSLGFAGAHQIGFSSVNWFMLAGHTVTGVALCVVLLRTHRLRWCILMHAIWNTGLVLLLVLVFSLL